MPLDATCFEDKLAAINVTPVSESMVAHHKRLVQTAFQHRYGYRSAVGWRTWEISNLRQLKTRHRAMAGGVGIYPAPTSLTTLARMVTDHIPDAKFSVEYFDADPILRVTYDGKTACLGIWDENGIVKLADYPHVIGSRWQRICDWITSHFE